MSGKAELDEIRGKSIVWNQLCDAGDFAAASQWVPNGVTLTVEGNVGTMEATAINSRSIYRGLPGGAAAGHKYYISVKMKADVEMQAGYGFAGSYYTTKFTVGTSWGTFTDVFTGTSSDLNAYIYGSFATIGDKLYVKDFEIVDLTLATLADRTAAQMAVLYPGFGAYNPGVIKNNDAASLLFEGFNVWDEELEGGTISSTTGQNIPESSASRSKNYIPVVPGEDYYITAATYIYGYDADKNYVWYNNSGSNSFTTPANVSYIRFAQTTADLPTNICINLSDSDLNGTYRPHQESTLRLGLNALRVPSHNIWDEEWELGQLDTEDGSESTSNDQLRAKNYIPVVAGTSYFCRKGHAVYLFVCWYDSDQEYISYSSAGDLSVTAPEGAAFARFYTAGSPSYGDSYQNDICINVSDAAFNGLYEPYGEDGVRTVDGLDGVGTAYDSVKSWKLSKRRWRVNLGSLSWEKGESEGQVYFYTPISPVPVKPVASSSVADIICTAYAAASYSAQLSAGSDKTISVSNSPRIAVKDSAFDEAEAEAFKAAMDGVYADFELATPIEYDLVGIIPGHRLECFAGGAEFVISPEDAETPSAPFIGEFSYPESAVRGIITEEVFKEFLEALGTAMGGTWTMTYDAATKTYSFSFTS